MASTKLVHRVGDRLGSLTWTIPARQVRETRGTHNPGYPEPLT